MDDEVDRRFRLALMQSGIGRDEEVFASVERTRQRFVRLILDRAG